MGASSSCSGEQKFRYTDFIAAMYDHDLKGNYIPDEEALGKLKNYASRNPERIPKICEKISTIMQKHLSRKPIAVQKVLMSVKAMYALLDDATFVDPFVPHVINMVSHLFAAKRHPFYLGGADLLTVMTMKMVQKNAPQNTRRLLKDNKAKLLPALHRMINLTTLLAPQNSATGRRRRSRTPSRVQSDTTGSSNPQRPLHPQRRFRSTSAQRKKKNLTAKVKKEAGRPTSIRTSISSSRDRIGSVEEDDVHFTLTHDPELSDKVALLSAGLIAIGNIIFCVPDLVQDFMEWRSLKIIVKHILHTVRHGFFLRQAQIESASGPATPAADFSAVHSTPLLPNSAIMKAATGEEACALTVQQHQMLLVQRSAMHALRACASAITAASIDSMIIMVMECFEEDGEDGAWEMHTAVDLVFHAFVSSLEQQSQKLGMCLCSAIAYVIFLGRVHLQYPPTSQIAPPPVPPASTLGGNLPGVLLPVKNPQEEQPPPRSVGRSILPTVEAATAAAAAARPPVRPEKIPKAFASPAALGGLLRALRQCLLVIPMSGTRPHVFLGAIQMLLGETAFLTSIGAPVQTEEDHNHLVDESVAGPSAHSPVSPFGSFVGTGNVHYSLTEAGHRAAEDDDEVSVAQQPFDVVLISLTTALLAAVHTQQNFPSLHLILSFLVETCKPTLVTGSGVLSSRGSGGGRRLRLFMLRLLVRTAPYFRSLPDAQRWDIDVYQCIAVHLYDLRQARNVSLATSILCQLLAGEPRTTLARTAYYDAEGDDLSKGKTFKKRAAWITSPRGVTDNNYNVVSGSGAEGGKLHHPVGGSPSRSGLMLHTSHCDIQRAREWILIVCHHRRDDVTPRILVELGNVFAALMSGQGILSIPFVLRSMWNLYVRHGGKCGGTALKNSTNLDQKNSSDFCEDVNEEDDEADSDTSLDGSAKENSSNVRPTHCDKAWQQFVLAVLAHIGVVFSIPEVSSYVLSIWNRKAAQGELSHCFSSTLKTSWWEDDGGRDEMKYVECGLQLFDPAAGNVWSPRSFGSDTPEGGGSTNPHLNSRADHALLEEEDAPFSHCVTPPPGAERSQVSLSFTMIARLLARARRSPIEEVFGCSELHDDEDGLVEAIVMHCFSTMAVEEYEAEVAASMAGSGATGEARAPEESALMVPSFSSALASPIDPSKPSQGEVPSFLQPVSSLAAESIHLRIPESTMNQPMPLISTSSAGFSMLLGSPQMPQTAIPPLSSMEYLSLVDELNRSAHQNNSSAQFQQTTTLETIPTSQSGGGPKASQTVKFSVGDREQIRKTMVTFDKRDFVNLPVPRSSGNTRSVSKLDQLFTFYGVNPTVPVHQTGLIASLPASAAPKPNSPRSRLRLRLKALSSAGEDEPVDAEEDNENSRSRPVASDEARDRRASRPLPASDSVGGFSTSSQGGRGVVGAGYGGSIFGFNASTPPAHRHQLGASGSGGEGNKSSRFRYRRATMKSSILEEEDIWSGTLDKVALRIALLEEEQNRSRPGGREEAEDTKMRNGRKLLVEETTWVSQLPMWQYFSIP